MTCNKFNEILQSRKIDDNQEIPRKTLRPQYSNFKEVFRERKHFITKSVDFGFNISRSCNNYIKSCKWNSSGSYLATTSQDRMARIFHFDADNVKVDFHLSLLHYTFFFISRYNLLRICTLLT